MTVHPYRTAWQTRDLDTWAQVLAPDVVLHSPIIRSPFRGREAAVELFGVLFETIGEMEITDEFAAENGSHAFYWRADVGGRWVEGTDLLRSDANGQIAEIRVMIRPLVDIAAFAAAIGPPLGAKRGQSRAMLVRLLTLPLRGLLLVADAVSSRLVQRR
jgi:hypothetical protein